MSQTAIWAQLQLGPGPQPLTEPSLFRGTWRYAARFAALMHLSRYSIGMGCRVSLGGARLGAHPAPSVKAVVTSTTGRRSCRQAGSAPTKTARELAGGGDESLAQ